MGHPNTPTGSHIKRACDSSHIIALLCHMGGVVVVWIIDAIAIQSLIKNRLVVDYTQRIEPF
jgi:hypothetical protein